MYFSIESLIIGIITFVLIIVTIRSSRMRIKDSIFWIVWTIALSITSFFPDLTDWLRDVLDIEDSNIFMFLIILIFSYFVMFRNAALLSQHEDKIKELTQVIAIQQLEQKRINKEILNHINIEHKED